MFSKFQSFKVQRLVGSMLGQRRRISTSIELTRKARQLFIPSKHESLIQCRCNAGPPAATLAQHYNVFAY